jgi:hypothetical protein
MIERLWKGFRKPIETCGAEMKFGMQIHRVIRCTKAPNHLGVHATDGHMWTRTPEEMQAHITELNQPQRDDL